jgi:hypothetical protein
MCVGRCACEGDVSAGTILPSQGATGAEKGRHRSGSVNSHSRLSHVERWDLLHDLGGDYLVKRDAAKMAAKLARRIKDLGFDVQYRAAA